MSENKHKKIIYLKNFEKLIAKLTQSLHLYLLYDLINETEQLKNHQGGLKFFSLKYFYKNFKMIQIIEKNHFLIKSQKIKKNFKKKMKLNKNGKIKINNFKKFF